MSRVAADRARRALRPGVVAAVAAVGVATGCAGPGEPAVPDPSAGVSSPRSGGSATAPPAADGLPQDVATGLAAPWGLTFLPDGSALVSVRDSAEIVLVGRDREPVVVGTVPDVRHGGEGGLLGIAASPTFARDGAVYVYTTAGADNRVRRLHLDPADVGGGGLRPGPAVLDGIPRAGNHNGGRIAFGPDGFLYVATGDAGRREDAQDLGSLAGKILRVTPDGAPAPGNPFAGSPVWSFGHRNVQGLAWDSRGRLWAGEFGSSRWDELNLIEPGGNYGWPTVEGKGGEGAGFVDPLVQWPPAQASPSGVAVVGDAVYVAALRGESLWRVPLEDGGGAPVGEPQRLLQGVYGRLRAVEHDRGGNLWLLTSNTSRGQPRPGDDRVVVVDPGALG